MGRQTKWAVKQTWWFGRCAPDGRPQVCSGSRRWTDADAVCALGVNVSAVCCLTRSPVTGAELHACVLAERCLPVDGGTR